MDKTKIGAIAILIALGAGLAFNKSSDAPAPSGEGDDDHAETKAPSKDHGDVVGGVKALKIEDMEAGQGAPAKSGDHLTMDYKGQLLDGFVFDQSYGKKPFDFVLGSGQVIKGWDKGIAGMKAGGTRKLVIPGSLGYGAQGQGEIPPNATLVFDVKLIKIEKK